MVMNDDQFIHYLLGFVDGEGRFHISIKNQKSSKMRWVLDPIFHVTQHKDGVDILYHLQKFIGCGRVKKKYGQPNTMLFSVESRRELVNKVIPFFKKYKPIVKRKNFEIFSEVIESLEKHGHGNVHEFRRLLKKVFLMNGEGRYRRYNLQDILKSLGSSETIRQTRTKLLES
jgi:hypothetical protein